MKSEELMLAVEAAKAACLAANQDVCQGTLVWHIHHGVLVEEAGAWDGCMKDRVSHIIGHKPVWEWLTRLERMRRVMLPRYSEVRVLVRCCQVLPDVPWRWAQEVKATIRTTMLRIHEEQCPKCPWVPHETEPLLGTLFP